MIDKTEILSVATNLSLSPDVVEKDYVLGWLLAGIYAHGELRENWTFKGGTCLKKCFFETYRFSEDLDFTVKAEAHFDAEFLRKAFGEVGQWLYDQTGLEVPTDQLRFEVYRNKRQGLSCEGRIYYVGPLNRGGSLPRIKIDLTADEVVVLEPVWRRVNHPYSDAPEGGISARCYAFEEVLAEKTRALGERSRPRDLYDVVNLFRNGEFHPLAVAVLDVLRRKCAFKGVPLPSIAGITGAREELLGDWEAMLGHQLPALPPFGSFWAELPRFFAWLEGGVAPPVLPAAPLSAEQQVFRPPVGFLMRQGFARSSALETIRFAAASRLCVDLDYVNEAGQRSVRRIEPYSLRRTNAGDILLYAVRSIDGQSRSYRLDRIHGAIVTDQTFAPRFVVELTPGGNGDVVPTARSGLYQGTVPPPARRAPVVRSSRRVAHSGTHPTYVFQCTVCGKKFPHIKRVSHLNKHKAPGGRPCPGRRGFLVDTRY